MQQAVAALLILATTLLSPPAPGLSLLRYRRSVGETATFHVAVEIRGTQSFQDEPRVVQVRAELEVTEQTLTVESDGSFWVRVTGRVLRVTDPTGTFGTGQYADWPAVQARITPLGETLETRPEPTAGQPGPFQRAFAAGMLNPAPVVLPHGGVAVGETWQWEQDGARQANRLSSVTRGDRPVVRIASSGRGPVHLAEASSALGLSTTVGGEMTQHSEVDLLLPSCVVAAQKGEIHLTTQGESVLELPTGRKSFPLSSDLRLQFRVELAGLTGQGTPGYR